jgi:hypothetical protein
MRQSELQLTDQKMSFGYTYVIIVTHALYVLPGKEFFTASCNNIILLIPLAAFHTLYSVSKNRWISAAVRFTAKSTECIFSDNLITIISWGQLQGYNYVARDTFVGLGIIYGFLPIHFVGLVNACGIYHQSNFLCSSLVGNNYCWLGSTAWEDGLTVLNFAEFRTA